jgi:hypothetical protein
MAATIALAMRFPRIFVIFEADVAPTVPPW